MQPAMLNNLQCSVYNLGHLHQQTVNPLEHTAAGAATVLAAPCTRGLCACLTPWIIVLLFVEASPAGIPPQKAILTAKGLICVYSWIRTHGL